MSAAKNKAYLIMALFLCLTAVFAWFARNFEIDASAETLLTKDNPFYLQTQKAAQRYNPAEFVLIAYEPNHKPIFSSENLNRVAEISEKIRKIERVKSVRSIINVPIFAAMDKFSVDVEPNDWTWQAQQYSPQRMQKLLASHPLYEGLLVNKKQTALGIQVVFQTPEELAQLDESITNIRNHLLQRELTEQEQNRLDTLTAQQDQLTKELDKKRVKEIEAIREMIVTYKDSGEFYLGGGNLLAYQLIKIIKSDLVLFGSLIGAIICFVLYYLFRQLRWVVLPVLCCAVSVVITMGLLAVLGLKVTVISANVVALQIILSLAVMIHLIVQYQELLQRGEVSQIALVQETIRHKVRPSFYAGLTTTIGFGSLIFSGVQPVISFGWMMVVAMTVTLTVSLVLFPALLISFLSVKAHVQNHRLVEKTMSGCAALVNHNPKLIITFSVLIFVTGVAGCFRLTAENSFLEYFSESTDVYQSLSYIDQHFGGSTPLDVLYTVPDKQREAELELTAEAVQTVGDIQRKLSQYEAIGNITSIADFTLIAKVVSGKPLTEYELTALYRSLDDELKSDLFGSYYYSEGKQIRISTRVQDTTPGLNRGQLLADIRQDMKELGIDESSYTLTNLFVLYQDILSRLVKSQFVTLGIVYLAMALVLWAIFKSLRVAVIALVPNVITTASIMGAMGLLGIPLDLMTLTIAAVAMGISVDDTIHYIHRFLEEKKGGADNAVRNTHLSVGYALIYTTLIIILGFTSLVFSDFVPSVLFGALTSAAMAVALLTDITILPVLLNRFLPDTVKRAR